MESIPTILDTLILMHRKQCIVLMKTRHVTQFSEMSLLFCFENYINTKCGHVIQFSEMTVPFCFENYINTKCGHVTQFSEMSLLFCFENYINTKCGQGQGIVISEAML
jgi:hypothetical protein